MKKIALAAAFSLAATSAFAGNLADPIIEADPIVVEETSSSAGGILVPLLFVIVAAAAAS